MQRMGRLCAWAVCVKAPSAGRPQRRPVRASKLAAAVIGALSAGIIPLPAQGPPSDPQAARLMRQALEAHGGQGAVSSLGDTVSQGRMRIVRGQGFEESGLLIQQGGFDRLRTVLDGPGERRREYVRDGRFAWWVEDGRKRPQTEEHSVNQVVPYNPASGMLAAFSRGRTALQGLGEEQQGGRRLLHRIGVLLLDSQERRQQGRALDRAYEILIDAQTMLAAELLVASRDWDRDQPEMWERYVYSDYREVEGVLAPFRIEMHRFGRLWAETLLDSIGPAPPGDVFREPEAQGGRP
ncbi:MAG: hypothetical protein V3T83_21910 [Acidobacteriota bacterium]